MIRKRTTTTSKKRPTKEQIGRKYGFRSGLEAAIDQQLHASGVEYSYESFVIPYTRPARSCRYTPDWPLGNGIIIESKGQFVAADRQKHEWIKEQHPDLDIRFVFSNPNARLYKGSKTTYAMWCEQRGFKYAKQFVPDEWLKEPPNKKSLAAIQKLKENAKKKCGRSRTS